MFLTSSEESKKNYSELINRTVKAIVDSFVDSLVNRGLSYLTKHRTRKIELTPFGKIKKKHKVLWDGKKN